MAEAARLPELLPKTFIRISIQGSRGAVSFLASAQTLTKIDLSVARESTYKGLGWTSLCRDHPPFLHW